MTQKTLSPRAWSELLLLSAIWGGSFLSIRLALDDISVVATVAHRVFWAALVLWVVIAIRATPLPRAPRVWLAFGVMGLLNNVIPFSLMAWGQLHIETGLTSILNAATAVFGVLVAAALFRDERLSGQKLIGVALGFGGVVVTIGPSALLGFDLRSVGQLAVLAGTLSYAFAGAWARVHLSALDPVLAAAGMLSASALVLVPAALVLDGGIDLSLSVTSWGAIGYISVVATAFAYLLYYRVLAMAGSGNLMLVTLLIVPFAVGLGAWARAETLTPSAILGFLMLALGLLVLDGRTLRWLGRRLSI